MTNYRKILKMHFQGFSQRSIEANVHSSHQTEKEKTALEEERSALDKVYKSVRADTDKLNYARQALEEYRRETQSHDRHRSGQLE